MISSDPTTQADRLRDAGLRATAARIAILALLESDATHPRAETIHEHLRHRLPSLSLSTVYGTLETFLSAGLIRRIQSIEGTLRVDGMAADHDHAVCRSCGEIYDVPRTRKRRASSSLSLPSGARLVGVHVEYEVLCAACQ